MSNSSRPSSSASRGRRSSKSSSRAGSVIGLPQVCGRSSRQASDPNVAPDLPFGFDDGDLDFWEIPEVNFGEIDGADGGLEPLPDWPAYPVQNDYDQTGCALNQLDPNIIFDLGNQTAPVRQASISLLQNSLSAVPGTVDGLGAYGQAQGLQPIAWPYYPQGPLNALLIQSDDIPQAPIEGKPRATSIRPENSINPALLQDQFAGFVGDYQPSAYPDPMDHRLFALSQAPYYGYGFQQQQLDENIENLSPVATAKYGWNKRRRSLFEANEADSPPRKKTRGHTCISPRSTTSWSDRSDSTYPTRSRGSSSNGDRYNAGSAGQMHKRKSVYENRFLFEKPKLDPGRHWIRTNHTTKGMTTRTAKCNNYDPAKVYTYTPHPLGNWSSGRYEFKYTSEGELKDKTLTACQIRDFILRYPEDKQQGIKLQLFIQVGPTDSARRYNTPSWNKCRFRECPAHIHQTGTILHGHYRVAFDERSFGTRNDYDPHLAASFYVHLYCLERFLDFEYLCRKAHVVVDMRQLSGEPKGRFAATLAGHPECSVAEDFVEHARYGKLRELEGFESYPHHADYKDGRPKPHEHTLTYHMHFRKAQTRPPAQIRQFKERGLTGTHVIVNMGDLEVLFAEVVKQRQNKIKCVKKRKAVEIEDKPSGRVDELVNKAYENFADAEPKHRKVRKQSEALEANSNESDDEWSSHREYHSAVPTRRSVRASRRPQPNYCEEPEVPQPSRRTRTASREIPKGYQPAIPHKPGPVHSHYDLRTSPNTRRRSSSIGKFVDPELQAVDLDALFADDGLNRRHSSLTSNQPGILRSPGSRNSSFGSGKRASFSTHPVTKRQTYDTEAPPDEVEMYEHEVADEAAKPRKSLRTGKRRASSETDNGH